MNKNDITEQRNKILKINTYVFTHTYQPSNCNHGYVETTINITTLSRPALKRSNNYNNLYSCYQK